MITTLILIISSIVVGVSIDRYYLLNHIQKDIELNQKEEYRTPLNDEYTGKKEYMYNYLLDLTQNKRS